MEFQRLAAVQRQVTYRPNPEVTAERVGSDVVLVHLRTNEIYELNVTGARLWELITAGFDQDELQSQLQAEFDVDTAELAAEVDAFLSLLVREQLITTAEREPDERE
jgi:hypothetical protein